VENSTRSGNVYENKGTYAFMAGMLLKGKVVSRWCVGEEQDSELGIQELRGQVPGAIAAAAHRDSALRIGSRLMRQPSGPEAKRTVTTSLGPNCTPMCSIRASTNMRRAFSRMRGCQV